MRLFCVWIVLVVVWGSSTASAAAKVSCASLFQQKKYAKAGSCFEREAQQTEASQQPVKIKRFLQGRMLRNAAAAFRKAAKQDQRPGMPLFWKERAVQSLQVYLKKKLCRKKYRCRLVKGELFGLTREIQYTQLTVQTGSQKAVVVVKGVRFEKSRKVPPLWNQQVRPGSYTVTVTGKGQTPQTKKVTVVAGKATFVPFVSRVARRKPPRKVRKKPVIPAPPDVRRIIVKKPRRKRNFRAARIGSGAVLGLGIAGIALGIGLAVVGHNQLSTADNLRQQLDVSSLSVQERETKLQTMDVAAVHNSLQESQEQAGLWIPVGWTFVGVGVVGAAVGTVGLLMHRHNPSKHSKSAPPSPKSKTSPKTLMLLQE